jgi:hypothetical protein
MWIRNRESAPDSRKPAMLAVFLGNTLHFLPVVII